MKLSREEGGSQSIFSDMLFSVVIILIIVVPLLMLLINPKAIPDANVKRDAHWIMEMSWPVDSDCDVDMWVRDPQNRIVFFRQLTNGVMSIERDDQGVTTDTIVDSKGKVITIPENLEIWTLRGLLDGEYVVNAHLFNCKEANNKIGYPANVPVTLKIIRINPRYNILSIKTKTMDKVWQEITMSRFELRGDGTLLVDKGDDFIGVVKLDKGDTLR
jgi:hypothetical protein